MEDLTSDFLASDEALVLLPTIPTSERLEPLNAITQGSAIVARKVESYNPSNKEKDYFIIEYEFGERNNGEESNEVATQSKKIEFLTNLETALNKLLNIANTNTKIIIPKSKFTENFKTIAIANWGDIKKQLKQRSKESLEDSNNLDPLKPQLLTIEDQDYQALLDWVNL
jgi:hypothetical protein